MPADTIEILHGHLCCGDGGGASGFNAGHVRVGTVQARFRCVGGIDADPNAIRDFERFAGAPGTCADLFSRDQFLDYHAECAEPDAERCRACGNTGRPPQGWREMVPANVRAAFQDLRPHIVFMSAPCKGFSGLMPRKRSLSRRYQALNRLTERCVQLVVDAYADDPVPLIIFENVPLIQTRGRALLDDIGHVLGMGGYAYAETVHDCGEVGGLAQHRRRFLLVARHRATVRPLVYVPPKRRVRGVGEVIGELPMPSDVRGGPMHRLSRLTWKTALRLALIPAGKDWRALEGMDFGALRVVPRNHGGGPFGVVPWADPSGVIAGESRPSNGRYAVADPRADTSWHGKGKYGVTPWTEPTGTVIAAAMTGSGAFAVADVRHVTQHQYGVYRVVPWGEPAGTVTSKSEPGQGAFTVADVRADGVRHNNVFRVVDWREPGQAVTAGGHPSSGGQAVADVRVASKSIGGDYETSGHYGVRGWDEPSGAVTSAACHDNGAWSVADPRPPALDEKTDAVIISLDNTWHRPFTTLELAALQGYDAAELMGLPLVGTSHTDWREHIGNRVPTHAATAIAEVFGETLLRHRIGEGFRLDTRDVWVRRLLAAVDSEVVR